MDDNWQIPIRVTKTQLKRYYGPPMKHKFNDNVHFRHAQVILAELFTGV